MIQLKIMLSSGESIVLPPKESRDQYAEILKTLDHWFDTIDNPQTLTIEDGEGKCRVFFQAVIGYQFIEPRRSTADLIHELIAAMNVPKEPWQE